MEAAVPAFSVSPLAHTSLTAGQIDGSSKEEMEACHEIATILMTEINLSEANAALREDVFGICLDIHFHAQGLDFGLPGIEQVDVSIRVLGHHEEFIGHRRTRLLPTFPPRPDAATLRRRNYLTEGGPCFGGHPADIGRVFRESKAQGVAREEPLHHAKRSHGHGDGLAFKVGPGEEGIPHICDDRRRVVQVLAPERVVGNLVAPLAVDSHVQSQHGHQADKHQKDQARVPSHEHTVEKVDRDAVQELRRRRERGHVRVAIVHKVVAVHEGDAGQVDVRNRAKVEVPDDKVAPSVPRRAEDVGQHLDHLDEEAIEPDPPKIHGCDAHKHPPTRPRIDRFVVPFVQRARVQVACFLVQKHGDDVPHDEHVAVEAKVRKIDRPALIPILGRRRDVHELLVPRRQRHTVGPSHGLVARGKGRQPKQDAQRAHVQRPDRHRRPRHHHAQHAAVPCDRHAGMHDQRAGRRTERRLHGAQVLPELDGRVASCAIRSRAEPIHGHVCKCDRLGRGHLDGSGQPHVGVDARRQVPERNESIVVASGRRNRSRSLEQVRHGGASHVLDAILHHAEADERRRRVGQPVRLDQHAANVVDRAVHRVRVGREHVHV
ncbi:hypothetical protein H310_06164 [Aphanomyces invadans]|uniref:Uncharacterized protein n=1 Tax=Aphanomyces invadans TaxID=157072 RepID=A0A024U519_9STRA|nr:hypothetical protein H310_06164 [Aphanomyces invadans]ETW01491.1 hypothetical protein H310_06164 [Aphanomyces invadans]|eukprot:XP_008869339.1 hypothetical protein H310_06164 [Aphanomyces invadans]